MSRKIKILAVLICFLFLTFLGTVLNNSLGESIKKAKETMSLNENRVLIILDPGHGGRDAGKIGINNAKEKDINLIISLDIKKQLEEMGVKAVLTRSTDKRLDETQLADLKARTKLINEVRPVLTVSIHQNSYGDERVHGAQVFYYSRSEEGEKAAEMIQNSLNDMQPENKKKIKANETYYILKNTEVPVVIAECGFLSNYEEAEKLTEKEYQKKLAGAVAKGILQYLNL